MDRGGRLLQSLTERLAAVSRGRGRELACLPAGVRPLGAARPAPKPQATKLRRPPAPKPLKQRMWRGAATLVLSGAIAYGLWAGGHVQRAYADLMERSNSLAVEAGFGVQRVILEGAKHTRDEDVVKALATNERTAIILYDTIGAQARLEKLPWIKSAEVMRLLPATMHVVIQERAPFAIWQRDGKLQLIDERGIVIAPAVRAEHPDLPLLVGEGADRRGKDLLLELAAYPDIQKQVTACVRVADRRWTLKLRSGLAILLPDEGIASALDTFQSDETQAALKAREVTAVDLRLADRVTFRVKPDPAAAAIVNKTKAAAGAARET